MKTISIGQKKLTPEDVYLVARDNAKVVLPSSSKSKIKKAYDYLHREISKGKTMYGVNTGFGLLSNVKIESDQIEELQYNILRSHAVGIGSYLSDDKVRAMLLLRAHALAQGHSGVQIKTVEQIITLLNKGVHPLIPEQGSVGASGDLAPLSHLALVLIGEGKARFRGKVYSGKVALEKAGIKPIRLGPKEGLALINGTQFITALGTLALVEAEQLLRLADYCGALTVEALRGTFVAFDLEIQNVRPHPGQIYTAKNLRNLLLPRSEIAKSHEGCGKVQDPYSLRCMPQVHGTSRDTLRHVREVFITEINAVTDNPLIFPDQNKIISGGNFHGQPVAMALDFLAIAIAEIASISEQRIEKLINPAFSELPPFLIKDGGLNSGFMIVQVAAASLVSENKTLCHPACVDSIPTSADKEDHVSMGAWAARKATQVVTNCRRVLVMESLAACQGIDLLRPLKSTKKLENFYSFVRKVSRRMDVDRSLHEEMVELENLYMPGKFNL